MPTPINNKVLIDNFYERAQTLGISENGDPKNVHNVTMGFQTGRNSSEIKKKIVSDIFKSLLLHDKLVIHTTDLLQIVAYFGIKDTIQLLKSDRFEFLDDKGTSFIVGDNRKGSNALGSLLFANDGSAIANSIEWLENKLSDKKTNNNKDLNILLLNAEKNNQKVDTSAINRTVYKETDYDINNGHVSKYLDISSKNLEDISRIDTYKVLRLAKLNKSLVYAQSHLIDSIVMDGEVQAVLNQKLSPAFTKNLIINPFDSYFSNLFDRKSLPDLSELYIRNIISIDDYLKIVNKYSAGQFRRWVKDKEFDPKEMEADIISSSTSVSNKFVKFIRWTLPDAIGLFSNFAGIAASFTDSYIVDKFMTGWHPNLFLDDVLRKEISQKISSHEAIEKANTLKKRFPDTERNDKCPCGSQKKFKKCCGA